MAEIKGKTSQDIQNSIRELIQNGILNEGELLPNIRALAIELEVNRNTVAAAYKDLALMGIVVSKGRAGTQVRKSPQINRFENLQKTNQTFFDLAHGNPCQNFLPQLNEINFNFNTSYLYGDSTKLSVLEAFARNEIFADVNNQNSEIEFTHGAVDAIERILNTHLIQSDSIAIEQPGFITSIHTLQVNRFNMVFFPVTAQGYDIHSIRKALEQKAKAIVITPRAQNPTSYSLDAKTAQELHQLFSEYPDVLIIIDDHFSLLATTPYYHIVPESTRHWAVIRSVSKFLGPDFRFAFINCDPQTATRLRMKLNPSCTWVSHILQKMIFSLMTSEKVHQLMNKAKIQYQTKNQEIVKKLLDQKLLDISYCDGLNLWIEHAQAQEIAYQLALMGWKVRLGKEFSLGQDIKAIRITTSELDEQKAMDLFNDLSFILTKIMTL